MMLSACIRRTYFATCISSCRRFATAAKVQPRTDEPSGKPKPKSATSLRRQAAASLPIRHNPTPTRSKIETVITLTTSESFNLSKLRKSLPPLAQKLHESWYIPRWLGENGKTGPGEIFIFNNGSIVCWGLSEEDARTFSVEIVASTPGVEIAPLQEAELEGLEFVMDHTETTRLQGDLIILGQSPMLPSDPDTTLPTTTTFPAATLLARYAFSQALSRSTALSALEVSLDDYLSTMALLPHSLQRTGKPGMGRRALIKKLGELMKFRQGLNLNKENFSDTPDFYWHEPELEKLFNSLSEALEVKDRTTAVNEKITYAVEVQSVLRQLLTESSSHRMELIIIALIAVEVVIALIRDGPELWDMLTGHPKDTEEAATGVAA